MDHHHLFYHDWDPDYHANQLKGIYRRWTSKDRERIECTEGPAHFLRVQDGRESPDALVLSKPLAEKIRKALCVAHQYWRPPKRVADEEKELFENEARTEAWEEELEHLIEVMKKKVKKTGQATDQERIKLQDLLEERKKCHKNKRIDQYHRRLAEDSVKLGKERWINAWFTVQQELDRLWYPGTESRALAQEPGTEDIEDHTANRGGRLDREVPIMPNVLALSLGPGLILDREDKTTGPGIVEESLIPMTMEGRNDRVGEVVDNLVIDLSPAHGRKGMTVDNTMDNTMTELNPRIHMMVLRVRVRRLHLNLMFRVIRNSRLEITAKPALDWKRPDGYRDEDSQISEPDVMPSAIMADDVEQSFSDVSIDDSVEAMAGQEITRSAPSSRQAQDFKNGLKQLALEYNKRDTPSPKPTEPTE
ncbi:uncharacterized protein J4E84_010647 [Alternaria hordeiaustralica]|uniref:uncharacterized protein n=1 Tax=Alternaria hordeiaustralica TaxID=1187925 RepID=UPI0020C41BA5|nr:uncharacterized protein J4E84_010647 [Alternaria hordeiaustralica]KAI4674272.1 hypothetical protein J4E84_010647 [Alternaria hordeiaustralica]